MPKVLNILFSSRKDHAAVNYIHSQLSKYLIEKKYEVTGLCLSGRREDWLESLLPPDYFWQYPRKAVKGKKIGYTWLLRWRLRRFICSNQFDVVICDGMSVVNSIAGIAVKKLPVVIEIQHGVPRRKDQPSIAIKEMLACHKLTLIAVSGMVKHKLCDMGYANEKEVLIIPNALDFTSVSQSQFERQVVLSKLSLPNRRFMIGVIGRLVASKQQQLLLESLVHLKESGDLPVDWVLVIVGDGPEMAALQSYSHKHHLTEQVVFTGMIEHASRYVKAFDVFVMPSNQDEGFGMVILEAMAGRVPVIANDTDVFRQLVVDDGCRFSLNDSESLAKLMLKFYRMTKQERDDVSARQFEYAIKIYDIHLFNSAYEDVIKNKLNEVELLDNKGAC